MKLGECAEALELTATFLAMKSTIHPVILWEGRDGASLFDAGFPGQLAGHRERSGGPRGEAEGRAADLPHAPGPGPHRLGGSGPGCHGGGGLRARRGQAVHRGRETPRQDGPGPFRRPAEGDAGEAAPPVAADDVLSAHGQSACASCRAERTCRFTAASR